MWVVIIMDSYYPQVFFYESYSEAKKVYDSQSDLGLSCVLAEKKESNLL